MSKNMKSKDLKDYVGVHTRLSQFHSDWPEGVIITERTDIGDEAVAFKAKVYRTVEEASVLGPIGLAAATGHAEEVIEGTKSVEKCETVAVGRALAILGYEIKDGIASADEMDSFKKSTRYEVKDSNDDDDEQEERVVRGGSRRSKSSRKVQEDDYDVGAADSEQDYDETDESNETEETERPQRKMGRGFKSKRRTA